ncbi:MAG: DNA polymerase III subunit alpha [Patescibacteria group bacterium]|nr:DNA polymerase III subunit alpha [Patescibacteria group bacterium]
MSRFTHLHTHSHYSLLNALPKVDELVKAAKSDGMTALALTDAGNMYGTIEFYKDCKKAEIKPIIGVDFYVAVRTRHDMQTGVDNRRTRLVLLAKDLTGYKNLIQLVTRSHLDGFYYKPRIDHELLEMYHDGLIAIAPSFSSDIAQAVRNKDLEKARLLINDYKKIFQVESRNIKAEADTSSEGPFAVRRHENERGGSPPPTRVPRRNVSVEASNFYIEITRHPEIDGHEELMQSLIKLARETDTPITAAHDVYYLKPEDREARETLMRVMQGGTGNDDKSDSDDEDFSFISSERARELFKDLPEALENNQKIADACNLELELGKWVFPNYIVPKGRTYDDELKRIVDEGRERRGIVETPELKKRVDYELEVIKNKGYAPYFLVVSDLLRHAHDAGILTTTRGSAAGSMVSYLSGITNVDPFYFNLPFERFLNPERPSAPDIDMDMADNRRDDMIKYARQKYGTDHVAQIGTFGTMLARGSVRDVARAMGFPVATGDKIAKLIPMGSQGFPMTIDRALKETAELDDLYKRDPEVSRIIDMAKKIEGCARHISLHAAGVVIAPTPLTDFSPLQTDPRSEGTEGDSKKIITQYDMHAIEDAGLLKFDFLGIRNLAILSDAVERVKKIEGLNIDIETIPIDDKKTFEMLARGETIGTFQLNGGGMTRYLMELKPTKVEDINLMVALYRPGPMDNINEYIARKNGLKPVTYMHPAMKKFLEPTYGVLVYQDDLLMTAIEVAGYSWGEVDKFRKAVGKKIPAEMAKQHELFVAGCQKHGGLSKKQAEEIWKLFEPFQGYGFNKAHAASYGKVAYQTAYMKANFPEIYMSAVLSAESGDTEKIAEIITECKRMNIPILPPDVNESFSQFTVIKDKKDKESKEENEREGMASFERPQAARLAPVGEIFQQENFVSRKGSLPERSTTTSYRIRFGLVTIKNFGQGIATAIITERKRGGKFKSLTDFLERVRDRNLNKKSLEALIRVGAMDCFGEDRGILLANLDNLIAFNKEGDRQSTDQDSLFGAMSDKSSLPGLKLTPAPVAETKDRLAWERELLGLYLSGHPLEQFRSILEKRDMNISKAKEAKENAEVIIAGIIEEVKPITTKKGDPMAFVRLADFTGTIEAVVFPRTLFENRALITTDRCVAVKGKISDRNGEKSLIIDKVNGL